MKIELNFHITKKLQHLLDVLKAAGAEPRFVGGLVRDTIIGIRNTDIDIATKLLPTKVMELLGQNQMRCIDTGSKYGTVTALIGETQVEITTLRIDTECDGRHTNPIFTDDFEQDAVRRDFTINAISYCPYKKELYDYTGGYDDLKSGKVRFIGEPKARIMEDHLRILRFFRFSDRFAKNLDKNSLEACINLRYLLDKISKERILLELDKMVMSPTAHKVFGQMLEAKILAEIMPGAVFDLGLLQHMYMDLGLRYAALLYKTPVGILRKLLQNLKFSNSNMKEMITLVLFRQYRGDLSTKTLLELKKIFYPLWVDNIVLKPYLAISDAENNINFADLLHIIKDTPPIFPINGDDLLALGITGKNLGLTLGNLKSKWIESEFALSKQELMANLFDY